ncbi:winged helix-turn-helix domain-containing protein [Pelagibacterium limicola]|uniref:winged helix-turn-helix domain-containing protein n=1 Tax=Pelagibacterium limicola TaxID=2791022 RepID=UPI0018AFC614|nr:winged helix-turn-helix domain-containing protein [Pelagibacterium limicola]
MQSADRFTVEFYQQDNQRLRARVDELEETVRQLRGQLEGEEPLPDGLPELTRNETALLRMMIARKQVSREQAMMAIYLDREDAPDPKIVDVWVSKLRRKLNPLGITFLTSWGRGWSLTHAGRAALDSLGRREMA